MNTQLEQLETAIRSQAKNLADSNLQAAEQQRSKILADANKQLTKREEREIEKAQAAAEQEYRRRVQAGEIAMQAELDQLRWSLVQSVMDNMQQHLQNLTSEEYINLLKQYLKYTATSFEDKDLVVEVNAEDYQLLAPKWQAITTECVPTKNCTLSTETKAITGGLIIHNAANRIRIDNSFEGLIARQENEIYQVITAQLFASVNPTRNI
ncbi:V-type ATP synthase subunit E family protein [Candidatus Halobeggiatoa sp. HSG11]|nr:V-type ATP synthase subunit E family protein [Candidatus Halobeggiatoa sp. HSG11]